MKKLLDPKNLPFFVAFVQAVLFSIAGNEKFTPFPFGLLVGFGVGIAVNWSMAVSSSRINDIAKARKPLAYLSLAALFCLSPVIICSTLGWTVSNFSWAVASDLSILLTGAIVGKSLISESQPAKTSKSEGNGAAQGRSTNVSGRKKKTADAPANIPCRYAGAGCGLTGTQNAMNAHARHCQYKPTVIDQSLLLKKAETGNEK